MIIVKKLEVELDEQRKREQRGQEQRKQGHSEQKKVQFTCTCGGASEQQREKGGRGENSEVEKEEAGGAEQYQSQQNASGGKENEEAGENEGSEHSAQEHESEEEGEVAQHGADFQEQNESQQGDGERDEKEGRGERSAGKESEDEEERGEKNEGESGEKEEGIEEREEKEDRGNSVEGDDEDKHEGGADSQEQNANNDDAEQGEENNESGEKGEGAEDEESEGNEDGEQQHTGSQDDQNEGEDDGENEYESEDDEGGESEDDEDEQAYSYQYNTDEVVDIVKDDAVSNRLSTVFWRIVENLMEEELRDETETSDVYYFDARRAIKRMILNKPLSYAFTSKEKESIIMILDNSGSMDWLSDQLVVLANLALQRDDVEIYIAPNGAIVARLTKRGREDYHADLREFAGRTIIYVGDYDGARLPVALSRIAARVIWICPEQRYLEPEEHDWAEPYIKKRHEFRGIFIRAFDIEEMLYYLSRVHPYTVKALFDPHEDEVGDNDEA